MRFKAKLQIWLKSTQTKKNAETYRRGREGVIEIEKVLRPWRLQLNVFEWDFYAEIVMNLTPQASQTPFSDTYIYKTVADSDKITLLDERDTSAV